MTPAAALVINVLALPAAGLARAATRMGAGAPDTDVTMRRVLMYVLLLLVAGVVFMLLTIWFRRQFLGGPKRVAPEGTVFSLADLRQLRADGLISQQEYEQTRDKIVQVAQKSLADASDDADKPPIDAPRTKDVDLIREAER
jgi:hypothetical protein